MAVMRSLDQDLQKRGGRWHYVRRIPKKYSEIDTRGMIRTALGTASREVARARRDALVEADEHYWASLNVSPNPKAKESSASKRYRAAQKRAMARGFIYTPIEELSATVSLDELLDRLGHVEKNVHEEPEIEAVMGTVQKPQDKVSEAFELYCSKLAIMELAGKSPDQKHKWRLSKQRAVQYFIDLCGDMTMDQITRQRRGRSRGGIRHSRTGSCWRTTSCPVT